MAATTSQLQADTYRARLSSGYYDDILVSIRGTEVSCLETPFVLLSIHYSGMCDNRCPRCHSKALWQQLPEDVQSLGGLMEKILELFEEAGLINGVCIMGTDNKEKVESVKILIDFCRACGMCSVVFTGYDLATAHAVYGIPDAFVCGAYHDGEWHENKRFYLLVDVGDEGDAYEEITVDQYFDQSIYV